MIPWFFKKTVGFTLIFIFLSGTRNPVWSDNGFPTPAPAPRKTLKVKKKHAIAFPFPTPSACGIIQFEKIYRIDSQPRFLNTAAYFMDGLWLIGSPYKDETKSEVWFSTDGSHWILKPTPPFGPRTGHALTVMDGKLWVIGGLSGLSLQNDIWSSPDGENWTKVKAKTRFSPRMGHFAGAFQGKLWVIGGKDNQGQLLNDVWSSKDGIHWTLAQKTKRFSPRSFAAGTVAQ